MRGSRKLMPNSDTKLRPRGRSARGNMIVLTVALLAGVIMTILYFSLQYARLLGTHHEQTTAIESAALAVAKDLSKIVIEDPTYGFVALSDTPPTAKGTNAKDNFYLPVQSINSLLATVRLDAIIADQLNDPIMQKLAQTDYDNAMKAKDALKAALTDAVQNGGTGMDYEGNVVNPLADAVQAYQDNVVRMTGPGTAKLVPDSMKLSLGTLPKLTCNTLVPRPGKFANMSDDQQENGFYRAYVNIPYGGHDFVFAAVSDGTTLVDFRQFTTDPPSVPFYIPSIVRAEADEVYIQNEQDGTPAQRTVHCSACAQPSSMVDSRPGAGALAVEIQGPTVPEVTNLQSVIYGELGISPCDKFQSPSGADSPPATMTDLTSPLFTSSHPFLGAVLSLAFYDWLRRCGPSVDVQSVLDALNDPVAANDDGMATLYTKDVNGKVSGQAMAAGNMTPAIGENQYMAVSGLPVRSKNGNMYDVIVADEAYRLGRPKGGQHAGEPILIPQPPPSAPAAMTGLQPTSNVDFPKGPSGGTVRPTYQSPSVAVAIIFRSRTK